MDTFSNLGIGLSVALTAQNLLYCFIGALLGTLIGILPGLGPLATVAMLLPITFTLDPTAALIMLAGIYYGAQYGGSTTAILVNLPGESSSVVTCLDGYQMARKGRAGPALAMAALASLFAGLVATVFIAFVAPLLVRISQVFGPAEYVSLMALGLIAAIVLSNGSLLKALAMIVLGLLLGTVGTDPSTMEPRLTMGLLQLTDGIGFVPLAVGIFALTEIVRNLENPSDARTISKEIGRVWPTANDFRIAWPAATRGTLIGSFLGVLPGGGAILASFAAYSVEKRLSKTPERFGHGAVEGVAAPEAANNAGAQTSFIPLLTLGLPSNPMMAMMAGAMMIHGIQPGPNVISSRPDLFWGVIASMLVGNVMLVMINMPLIGIWMKLLNIPYRMLYIAIVLLCCIGVYSVNNSTFDVILAVVFGILGYVLSKFDYPPAPLLLAFILSPMIEENFRRTMLIFGGDFSVFVLRPISLSLLAMAAVLLLVVVVPAVRFTRQNAFQSTD